MTAVICTLAGAGIGLGVALAIYVVGFVIKLFSCVCNFVTCNCDGKPIDITANLKFTSVVIFCVIGGAIIGLCYGIYKMREAAREKQEALEAERSEQARQQRVQWASEAKQIAQKTKASCEKKLCADTPLVKVTSDAEKQMEAITEALTDLAETEGIIRSIASRYDENGGGDNEN